MYRIENTKLHKKDSSKGAGMGSIGVGVAAEVKAPPLPHEGWSAF